MRGCWYIKYAEVHTHPVYVAAQTLVYRFGQDYSSTAMDARRSFLLSWVMYHFRSRALMAACFDGFGGWHMQLRDPPLGFFGRRGLSVFLRLWFVWLIVRCVRGMKVLARGEPYPNPKSWLFG